MKIAPIGELAPPPTPPDPPETEVGFNPELIQLAGCNRGSVEEANSPPSSLHTGGKQHFKWLTHLRAPLVIQQAVRT